MMNNIEMRIELIEEEYERYKNTVPEFLLKVFKAYRDMIKQYPESLNSLHEGFAFLNEEVDELWDIVKQKQVTRDPEKVEKELLDIITQSMQIYFDCVVKQGCKK